MMFLLLAACSSPDDAAPFETGWTLVWTESFDGAAGSPPDPEVWVHDVGGDGWGNAQLEYNTDRTDNAALDGEGRLAITARREAYQGNAYTSARITTNGLKSFGMGRIEADLQMPAGQGLWPAFWMLGTDFGDVGWPDCGEIDIMELRGEEPEVTLATVHGPGYSGPASYGDTYRLRDSTFADGFHTFAVDIEPDHLAFWMDDARVHVVRPGDLPGAWAFDDEFFLLLNLAVGGYFLDEPTDDTPFPATFLVDEVRAYERTQPQE
jgi:beta-glucanase (GH16 family)